LHQLIPKGSQESVGPFSSAKMRVANGLIVYGQQFINTFYKNIKEKPGGRGQTEVIHLFNTQIVAACLTCKKLISVTETQVMSGVTRRFGNSRTFEPICLGGINLSLAMASGGQYPFAVYQKILGLPPHCFEAYERDLRMISIQTIFTMGSLPSADSKSTLAG
jgi:hypothetical protein